MIRLRGIGGAEVVVVEIWCEKRAGADDVDDVQWCLLAVRRVIDVE